MSAVDGPSVGGRRRRQRLRAWAIVGAGTTVLAVAAAATIGLDTGRSEAPTADPRAFKTVPVTRGDLVEYLVLDGAVGYGTPVPMRCAATGTVTWIAAAGAVVRRGKALLRVDDQPVVLLYGRLPMFRQLAEAPAGAEPTSGRDVEQFERNLRSFGYTGFTVDDTYSAATTRAVKSWQRDLGKRETGRVEPGDVVYAPGAVRIARHSLRVGAPVPADVLAWTGTTRVITTTVERADAGWATSGVKVTVTLPSGRAIPGTVDGIGEEATAAGPVGDTAEPGEGGDAATRVPVTVAVADQKALAAADTGTVEVRRVAKERRNVLTVPVSALLALAEGGYGLEVADGASPRIVAVRAGMFADGRVEVTGAGVDAGMNVRIPQ
ncbi:MAG TPA: peptidoglycan-binding protein [Pilimelia sp.]|nr:peptidoglycan-binding protein [Pilimelia sp.]